MHLDPWNDKAIALLDLDAFFASVEQLDHPNWRNKPVIVGGDAGKRGVVAAASYEARAYGVHSAMPAGQAQKLCPTAIWTHGRYERYREMSDKVMSLIKEETPYIEQVSIDEAFFDISPGRYSKEHPIKIAKRIQKRVAELGITCSIGLSTNKTCSKIASNINKPHGFFTVFPGDEKDFLYPLPIAKLSGIGKSTQEKLHRAQIKTLGQLADADDEYLKDLLGINGAKLKLRAQGINDSEVDTRDEVKSVSNERTFVQDISDRDELISALAHICSMLGARLRKHNLKGATLTLKLRYDMQHNQSAQCQMAWATDNEFELIPYAQKLFNQTWQEGRGVRLIGLGVSNFNQTDAQMNLFSDEKKRQALDALAHASDKIKEKFGDDTLQYGRNLRFKESFSKTSTMNKKRD